MKNFKFYKLIFLITLISFINVKAQNPVIGHQKFSELEGGFTGPLDDGDSFGAGCDSIGDLDGDGVVDIAISATRDDDGGTNRGAVYILFLNSDGTVKAEQKISSTQGNFTGILDDGEVFGTGVSSLGDLNGDGISDLAVSAEYDGDGGVWHGAVWILFLDTNGTVQSHQKISDTEGGFTGILSGMCTFGSDIANLGDLDGDGNDDLAAGSRRDDDGGTRKGAVWILFLNSDGTVKSHQKISDTQGNFTATLENEDQFGRSVTNIGDLNGDGVVDIAVGAYLDDDGGTDKGAVYILFLDSNGTVQSHQKISDTQGGFSGVLNNDDWFGVSAATIGDLNWDGVVDIVVGAMRDDTGGADRGAVYILYLNTDGTVQSYQKIASGLNYFTGILNNGDVFGRSVASIGIVNSAHTLLAGARDDDDSGIDAGAGWLIFIKGVVASSTDKIIDDYFNIYPVLTKDYITIELSASAGKDASEAILQILTVEGKIVKEITLNNTNNKVNLTSFKKGVYFVRIKTDKFSLLKKIVKM